MRVAHITFLLISGLLLHHSATAQWSQDFSNMIEISNVKAMEASSSHLYVLSDLDGMAVFRIKSDSLQWL